MIINNIYILTRNEYLNIINFIQREYNIDISKYSFSITKRRIEEFLRQFDIKNSDTIIELLKNKNIFERLWEYLHVPTTEMFRDASVWKIFQQKLLEKFENNDFIKIWLPEVTTDDELYTTLIALYNSRLQHKTRITVSSELKNEKLTEAVISEDEFQVALRNYQGTKSNNNFHNHFIKKDNQPVLKTEYFSNVVFRKHSFAKDERMNEVFDIVIFRNRMLYFNPQLQNSALTTIYNSLAVKGYLIIGLGETLNNWSLKNKFNQVHKDANIFQKRK